MRRSIVIGNVRCSLEPTVVYFKHHDQGKASGNRLCLEIPAGWSGEQLRKWKESHRLEAIAALIDDSEAAIANSEPELYMPE